jgi:CRISPR-associated protein Csm3
MKLIETKIVAGTITLETGLHIGGSKSSLDIGGLDSPVIKTPQGIPYIPGSSLKGKIRSLLGIKEGSFDLKNDSDVLVKMFGSSEKGRETISRLIFRDAQLDEADFKKIFTDNDAVLDTAYTEAKYENKIDRKSGTTDKKGGGIRQIERVPAGAKFNFEIVINVFDEDKNDKIEEKLKEGITLLENNYLGGSGSRGYGKVKIDYEIK